MEKLYSGGCVANGIQKFSFLILFMLKIVIILFLCCFDSYFCV